MKVVPPDKLYKFVTGERIDILRNCEIRFTQPGALNDPFELRPLFGPIVSENKLREIVGGIDSQMLLEALRTEIQKRNLDTNERVLVEITLKHLEANPELLRPALAQAEDVLRGGLKIFEPRGREMLQQMLAKELGILSTSATIKNPLLWAHYADSHRGFALILNPQSNFFDQRRSEKDELFHLRSVEYREEFDPNRALVDMESTDIFAAKQKSWSYEEEWRMLVLLERACRTLTVDGDSVHLFSIPTDVIMGVVLGVKASSGLVSELEAVLSNSKWQHVKLYRARLDSNTQGVELDAWCGGF